jgi:CRISPR-associated protein Cmr3
VKVWKPVRLVPDDVLFFRDGKPSSRGSDHYLRSLFPPYPSTLYGALRARRLFDEGVELDGLAASSWRERLGALESELGAWGGFGSLAMRGPWLVRGEEPLLPAPADLGLVLAEAAGEPQAPRIAEVVRFRPLPDDGQGGWSHPLRLLAPFRKEGAGWQRWDAAEARSEPRSASGWFLRPGGWSAWRSGGVPAPHDFVHPSALWMDEVRTGIGLQSDRRAGADGLLYTFGFIRLRAGVALGFEVTGSAGLDADGRVRLGGEGRTAALAAGPAFPAADETGGAWDGERLACCFATPTLSETGGYPPGFGPHRLEAELAGRPCRLVAAVVPKPAMIGGWDIARHRAKPLRRAIPAGSVFLFDGKVSEIVHALDGSCLADFPADHLARQGFGLVVAGASH